MFLSRSVVASAILIPTLVFAGANPPQAPKKPHEITEVGHTRHDPFFWLREKDNPEVLKYLEAENRPGWAKACWKRPIRTLVIPNSAISTPSFHSIHFMLFKFAQ